AQAPVWVTVKEAARISGIQRSRLYELFRRGDPKIDQDWRKATRFVHIHRGTRYARETGSVVGAPQMKPWRILEPIEVGLDGIQVAVFESVIVDVDGQKYICVTPVMHTTDEIRFYKKQCGLGFDRAEALLHRLKREPPKPLFEY